MAALEPFKYSIPLNELDSLDEYVFSMLHMDRDQVMEQFDDVYEETFDRCAAELDCQCLYESFPIEEINDAEVRLCGGVVLESAFLARMLQRASEVVLYAVTVHGFEELANNPQNDVFEGMFYNGWGVGFSMAAHRWLKEHIAKRAEEAGLYTGRSWIPGEDELEFELQAGLFKALDPSRIGLSLTGRFSMTPVMSVSGFMGLSADPLIATDGIDKPSSH